MPESIVEIKQVGLTATIDTLIRDYLGSMSKDKITNLYDMVLEQIEPSLFRAVIEHCRYNQSKAAAMLGLSRGTCRTKLIKYFGDRYCGSREEAA